jgi:hypothetical protein
MWHCGVSQSLQPYPHMEHPHIVSCAPCAEDVISPRQIDTIPTTARQVSAGYTGKSCLRSLAWVQGFCPCLGPPRRPSSAKSLAGWNSTGNFKPTPKATRISRGIQVSTGNQTLTCQARGPREVHDSNPNWTTAAGTCRTERVSGRLSVQQ